MRSSQVIIDLLNEHVYVVVFSHGKILDTIFEIVSLVDKAGHIFADGCLSDARQAGDSH